MQTEHVNVREASRQKTDEIKQYILAQIESGTWPSGHKIPTEKSISEQFSAARNTVRKALGQLEAQGSIVRHVGRGTFVRHDPNQEPELSQGLPIADASPADINEIRVIIEPAIAEFAVARASRTDLERARLCLSNSLKAKTIEDFEHWDAQLHAALIAATKNDLLIRVYEAIHQARQRLEWYELKRRSLDEVRRGDYDKQHAEIVTALERRDALALRSALERHLRDVSANMLDPTR